MNLNAKWSFFLEDELKKQYFTDLIYNIDNEYKSKKIFPNYEDIFRAFNLISPDKIKVIIIGQDPYHGLNQANGLAFSVSKKCKIPPSLKNIFKELSDDIGCDISLHGDLTSWAKQGVLLINTTLTVQEAKANSHKDFAWDVLTNSIIKRLSLNYKNIVFILWGSVSQKKELFIDSDRHLVLKAPHPSPLSSYRGFFGSKPFSKSNEYLIIHKKKEINWCLS
ncbi:MAG: uracil-DNA glycosylase [Flavobacteriaceae bacterium]|nr:uracil-DNA glycosylase [Flavobacteriaceae bacterium]